METEITLKLFVVLSFILYYILRIKMTRHFKYSKRLILREIAIFLFLILYLGSFFDFAKMNLPLILRIFLGIPIFIFGLFIFFWGHRTLGENWSSIVEKKPSKPKNLVKTGPYRYVRHPLYTSTFMVIIGLGIIISNWILSLGILLTFTLIYLIKIPKEERFLIKTFGKRYKDYMQKTGKIFPKL